MTKTVSYHARHERQNRIDFIIDWCKGEFGAPIATAYDADGKGKRVLTDKGLLIVYSAADNKLITMWIASVLQGVAVYKASHKGQEVPWKMMQVLHNNKKANENQPKN